MIEKTILIADDDDDLCQALALRCRSLGMNAAVANDGIRALQLAEKLKPDLICLDVDMPGGNGLAVCEVLSSLPSIGFASIAILTGRNDFQTIERCRQLGANYIYKGGRAWSDLETLINNLMGPTPPSAWIRLKQPDCVSSKRVSGARQGDGSALQTDLEKSKCGASPILHSIFAMLGVDEKFLDPPVTSRDDLLNQVDCEVSLPTPEASVQPWVLLVDDDTDFSNAMKMRLEFQGVSVVQACTGCSGIKQAFIKPVSAIILDLAMPGGDGRHVLEILKTCESTASIPIIVLTGFRGVNLKQEVLSLGAASFLEKPVHFDTLFSKLLPHLGLPRSCGGL